jgi:hypothetical protein
MSAQGHELPKTDFCIMSAWRDERNSGPPILRFSRASSSHSLYLARQNSGTRYPVAHMPTRALRGPASASSPHLGSHRASYFH